MESMARAYDNDSCRCHGAIRRRDFDEHMGISDKMQIDENLLAKEMNDMTVKERELVYEELHGVSDIMEETPDLLSTSLRQMREELCKVPKYNKKALDRALFLKPYIETDDNFHLMFLRAERFDPYKAAIKMYRHFEHKLTLFGDEKLVKRITLDDLGGKERSMIYSGACQFLLTDDKSGRAIFLLTLANYDAEDTKAFTRYAWFQVYSILEENEEMQKRGVVEVMNISGHWKSSAGQMLDFLVQSQEIIRNLPFRICGLHLCYNQPVVRRLWDTFFAILGKDIRIRQRLHYGSAIEMQYALLTFGIVLPDWFASGNNGTPSREYIETCLARCRKNEAAAKHRSKDLMAAKPGLVLHPEAHDILLGRGRPFHSWYGNARLSNIVSKYVELYMNANDGKGGKTEIAMAIVEKIYADGGKFLQRGTNGFWEIVSDEVAKEKVSQNMRAEVRKRQSVGRHQEPDPSPSRGTSFALNGQEFDILRGTPKRPRIG